MYTISDMVSGKDKNSEWLFLSTLVENKKYIYLQNSVSFLKPMELFESWSWALGDIKNTRHLSLLLSASAASSSVHTSIIKMVYPLAYEPLEEQQQQEKEKEVG